MPEIRSPLTVSHAVPAAAPAGLRLAERAPGGLLQIAGWADFEAAAAPALAHLGFEGLGNYREVRRQGPASAYRLAPDRLLLRHETLSPLLKAARALDPERACFLDLSHARWVFAIEGPAGPDLLARLLPIDCDPEAFPVEGFAQTAFHHVGVLLDRRGPESWELLVPVTWARSLWDYLGEAAAGLGGP